MQKKYGILNVPENYEGAEASYGKTVKELIDEGKQYMKEDNITPKEWKKSLEEISEEQ